MIRVRVLPILTTTRIGNDKDNIFNEINIFLLKPVICYANNHVKVDTGVCKWHLLKKKKKKWTTNRKIVIK